jgi:hypothetical protein
LYGLILPTADWTRSLRGIERIMARTPFVSIVMTDPMRHDPMRPHDGVSLGVGLAVELVVLVLAYLLFPRRRAGV